jgi:hypothetical protein
MIPEPRNEADYSQRQTVAARRVLVDVGQADVNFGQRQVLFATS